jgi:uncharacterized caspase-like protein
MPSALAAAMLPSGLAAQAQSRGLETARTADGQTVELYEESHALVIGMIKYQSGWRPLPGVESDVVAIGDLLKAHGFTVRVERDLTRDAFDRTLRQFIAAHGMQLRNRLLIYFAGHGHTQTASDGRQFGYIVPVDAPSPLKDPTGFRSRAISMDQIEVYAREIESRHAMMVFDSCFSGTLFDVSRALPGAIASNLGQPVRQFITSGSAGQEVPDTSEFRRQFVAALQGEADLTNDGYISGTELGLFLEDRVASYTRQAQTPKFGKIRDGRLDKGDIIFQSPSWTPASRVSGPPAPSAPSPPPPVAEALDRSDPVATSRRFFEAIGAKDVKAAYALLADQVKFQLPESAFAVSSVEPSAAHIVGEARLIYEERADGTAALIIFATNNHYRRISLLREGTRWGTVSFRILPTAAAVPAHGPPFRDVALELLQLVNENRSGDAYKLFGGMLRAQVSEPQFAAMSAPHTALGAPKSRELVYVEQDAPLTAFVIFRTRYAGSTLFERISLVLENAQWKVIHWGVTPTTSPSP